MRGRPLVFCVPAAAAALYLSVVCGVSVDLHLSMLMLALLLAALAFTLDRPRLCAVLCLASAATAALTGLAVYDTHLVAPVRALHGQTRTVSATVCRDANVYDDRQRAELRIEDGADISGTFRTLCYLPLTNEPLRAGDTVNVAISFYIAGDSEGFDRAAYQAAEGCYITSSYAEDKEGNPVKFTYVQSTEDTVWTLPQRVTRHCKQLIAQYLSPRESGLLTALLFGDKSGLDDADAVSMKKAGLSHLIAVSGMHVGFLVAFCFMVFGKRVGTLLSVVLICFFVPMAGATPSAVRAGIMYLVSAGAFCLKREADSLNSLCVALLLLLAANPYAIASLSLQLSFTATFGLILLSGRMQRRLMKPLAKKPRLVRRLCGAVAGALSCSVCALLFTTPILLSAFGYVSVLSLLSNLLVVGLTGVCFIAGLLFCVAAWLAPAVAVLLAWPLGGLLHSILFLAARVAALPFGLIYWGDGFGLAALLLFFAAALGWVFFEKRIRWRLALPAVCISLAVLTGLGVYYKQTHYLVTYLPCGDGQSIVVSLGQKEMALIDCSGGGYRDAAAKVREWMQWNNFSRIDTLVLTAVDLGHARDLPELLAQTEVERIVMPAGCKRTKKNGALLDLLDTRQSDTLQAANRLAISENLPLSAFPVTNGKLGVFIGQEILVLHSPTQKQLAAVLDTNPLTAKTVVLSAGNIADLDLLREALSAMGSKAILLQTGATPITQIDGIPVESPYISGEIRKYYRKE